LAPGSTVLTITSGILISGESLRGRFAKLAPPRPMIAIRSRIKSRGFDR
jgi:hypothetical protein